MSTDDIAAETGDRVERPDDSEGPGEGLPEIVDWILGVAVALAGLLAVAGGAAIGSVADRESIAELLEDEDVTATVGTEELTTAEATDLAATLLNWVELGLFVVGGGLLVVAVGYVAYRRRARRRRAPDERLESFGTHALLGAVVGAVLSFVPLATGLGGAVSGYFEQNNAGRPTTAGGVSGLLIVVPVLVLLVFVLIGLVQGLQEIGQGGETGVVAATIAFAVLVSAAFAGALGAAGGFVGGKIAED